MEEVAFSKQMESLKLTDEEKGKVISVKDEELNESIKDLQNMAVHKILAEKHINLEVFKNMIPIIWNIERSVQIKSVGENLFECFFSSFKRKRNVIKERPWNYDKALLLFKEIKGNERYSKIEFRYASFWIHFLYLPKFYLSRKWVKALCNVVGTFKRVDIDKMERDKGESMRIRVKLDVRKLLRRGTMIKIESRVEEE